MFKKYFFIESLLKPLKIIFKRSSISANDFENIKSIIIFWPKTSLGVLGFSRVLIQFLKKKYNDLVITVVIDSSMLKKVDPILLKNLLGLSSSDSLFTNKQLKFITKTYDISLIPSFENYSFPIYLKAALTKSKIRFGISKINDISNPYSFILDNRFEVNQLKNQFTHLTEIIIKILKPLGFHSIDNLVDFLTVNPNEIFTSKLNLNKEVEGKKIILINNQPENLNNRWGIENLVRFISNLVASGNYFFYYIEDEMDPEIKEILEQDIKVLQFVNKNKIEEILQIITVSNLVVTCSSDIMHLAGLFNVPQISIFGTVNPFISSPLGPNKKFIKASSGLIDEITGEEVYEAAIKLLEGE